VIDINEFKDILAELQVIVPEESLSVFRDLVDAQADSILESWIQEKVNNKNE
jgi:hypothetical protein